MTNIKEQRELYHKYKGQKAQYGSSTGIICGYDSATLIMAVTEGSDGYESTATFEYGISKGNIKTNKLNYKVYFYFK